MSEPDLLLEIPKDPAITQAMLLAAREYGHANGHGPIQMGIALFVAGSSLLFLRVKPTQMDKLFELVKLACIQTKAKKGIA